MKKPVKESAADLPNDESVSATAPVPIGSELGVQLWQRYGTSPGVISARPMMRMINRIHQVGSGNLSFLSSVQQRWTTADQENREPHLTYAWPSLLPHSSFQAAESFWDQPPRSHHAPSFPHAVSATPIRQASTLGEQPLPRRAVTQNLPSVSQAPTPRGGSAMIQQKEVGGIPKLQRQRGPAPQPGSSTVASPIRVTRSTSPTLPQSHVVLSSQQTSGSSQEQPPLSRHAASASQPVSATPIRKESKLSEQLLPRRTATSLPDRSVTGKPRNTLHAPARTSRVMIQRKEAGGISKLQRQQNLSLQPGSSTVASLVRDTPQTLSPWAKKRVSFPSDTKDHSSLTKGGFEIRQSLAPANPVFLQRKKKPEGTVIQRTHMKPPSVETTHAPEPSGRFIYRKASSILPESVARIANLPFIDTDIPEIPPTAREFIRSTSSALPFSHQPSPLNFPLDEETDNAQSEGPDFEELMERVCRRLSRQLIVEQERRGRIR